MYKILIIAFSYLVFNSCSNIDFNNNGDILIGDWYFSRNTIKIVKAGEYYHITYYENGQEHKDYCIYEKGCFKLPDTKKIIVCETHEKDDTEIALIFQGNHYYPIVTDSYFYKQGGLIKIDP